MMGMVIGIILIATSCSSSSSEETPVTNAGPLQSFIIQCGGSYYRRTIDQSSRVISLSGIHFSADITGVSYQLAEGATIAPAPQSIALWNNTQEFTVTTADGSQVVYTVNLPDLQEPEPELYKPVVLGYLPLNDFQYDTQLSHIHWEYLTHVAICFLKVKSDGTLNPEQVAGHIVEARNTARKNGVKVLISLCKNTPKEFTNAIKEPSTRTKLVEGIINFVEQYELDGFDIDYEEYSGDQGAPWWNQYRPVLMEFFKELYEAKEAAHPEWLMTSATADPTWLNYGVDWQQYFDFLNLMSYDRYVPKGGSKGSFTNAPGPDATMANFTGDLTYWNTTLKTPKEKLLGGLPFYGFTWENLATADDTGAIRYFNILSEYSTVSGIESMNHYGKTYWNGPEMIREKCQYVKDNQSGGVIIWQLFMDAKDDSPHKLLDVIGKTFQMDKN